MMDHSSRADEWIALALDRYLGTVYRLAYARTRSRQDAEDVTQEVMLKLVSHAHEITGEEHLKAWLLRVTANQTTSLFRTAWRRLTLPLNDAVLPVQTPQPPNDALDEALGMLNRDLRTVIHLYYYEDMSTAEIAHTLHIRPEAVRKRLSRARKLLQNRLTGEGRMQDDPR